MESICDGKIGIRRFRLEDIAPHYEAVSESLTELCNWMVWCNPDYTIEDSRKFISTCDASWANGESYSFVIFDVKTGMLIGSIGFSNVETIHRSANLGYWIRKSRTGEGIAPAAVRLIAQFGFNELGLNRLEFVVPTANRASQRVAEKSGAKRMGVARKRLVLNGETHDAYIYSIIREDLAV